MFHVRFPNTGSRQIFGMNLVTGPPIAVGYRRIDEEPNRYGRVRQGHLHLLPLWSRPNDSCNKSKLCVKLTQNSLHAQTFLPKLAECLSLFSSATKFWNVKSANGRETEKKQPLTHTSHVRARHLRWRPLFRSVYIYYRATTTFAIGTTTSCLIVQYQHH